jgi:plastocyanin
MPEQMMKVLLRCIVLGFLLSAPSAWAQERRITISEYAFSPAQLTITAGTKVTWTNLDQVPHSVVEKDKIFRSAALDTNDSYSFEFTQPGTYRYFCSLHPQMTGTVIVVKRAE